MIKKWEDDLVARRRAMMSTETVLDYKKRMDAARAEVEARGQMEEAEKWAKLAEELKAGPRFHDMKVLGEPAPWRDYYTSRPSIGCSVHNPCPICKELLHAEPVPFANIQSLPPKPTRPGVFVAEDHDYEYVGIEAEFESQLVAEIQKAKDRRFLDLLEKYLPLEEGIQQFRNERRFRPIDPIYDLVNEPPLMRVTSSDPTKSKADVWAAVKKFLDSQRDKTLVPVLPSDIRIEPLTPDVLRDGFRHLDRERPRDCWEKAREALNRLPGDTPLFYNEVLGEYSGTHIRGNRVDLVYIDEVNRPNKNRDDFCAALNIPKRFTADNLEPPDPKAFAARMHANGKISDTALLQQFGVEDEVEAEVSEPGTQTTTTIPK